MKKFYLPQEMIVRRKRFQKGLLENGIEILTINDIDKK